MAFTELSNCPDLQKPALILCAPLTLEGGSEGRGTFRAVCDYAISIAFDQSGNCLWHNRHFRELDIEIAVMRTQAVYIAMLRMRKKRLLIRDNRRGKMHRATFKTSTRPNSAGI